MARQSVLSKILTVLIEEWGKDQILDVINNIELKSSSPTLKPDLKRYSQKKLNAVSQAERFANQSKEWEYISQIADRYDHKHFLPSVSDVKQFLLMNGQRTFNLKDRYDGFRIVLQLLRRLPAEDLQKIASSSEFSGPARLGPISDAISAVGGRMPRWKSEDRAQTEEQSEGVPTPKTDE